MFQAHVENLEGQVKEQEVYHNELQEVERWLLQMSSRMVTPDPTVNRSLETATQQLAKHKVSSHCSGECWKDRRCLPLVLHTTKYLLV